MVLKEMKNNTGQIHDCYGCGVCAASCGKKIIKIRLNKNGFYQPYIDEPENCSECGICLEVCAFNHEERALKPDEVKLNPGLHGAMMRMSAKNVRVVVLVSR